MYLSSSTPILPSIPRTSKPVSSVLHIHRCPHSLTEFYTHVELTNFRTGSRSCTVLHNRFIIADHRSPHFCFLLVPLQGLYYWLSGSTILQSITQFSQLCWWCSRYTFDYPFNIPAQTWLSAFCLMIRWLFYRDFPLTPLIHTHLSVSARLVFICSRTL